MRRRRALASREEAYQLAAVEADRIHSTLMRHAVDGKRRPPPDRSLTGKDEVTVLNGTYLVDSDAVDCSGKPLLRCRCRREGCHWK
jgi:hypothetical protein